MAKQKLTDRELEQQQINRLMNTVAFRCTFYRLNPQRFVKDYLNIKLHWFQAIILWCMMHMPHSIYLAARGRLQWPRRIGICGQ